MTVARIVCYLLSARIKAAVALYGASARSTFSLSNERTPGKD
jgi:hypothetical protein